jgi:hypothetical protein
MIKKLHVSIHIHINTRVYAQKCTYVAHIAKSMGRSYSTVIEDVNKNCSQMRMRHYMIV